MTKGEVADENQVSRRSSPCPSRGVADKSRQVPHGRSSPYADDTSMKGKSRQGGPVHTPYATDCAISERLEANRRTSPYLKSRSNKYQEEEEISALQAVQW
ncbi:hypothetical protein TNCT_731261 [Trichonephila clavata]|uniref:Uncharacterized protein n=1 Tax=Trichonephila clavata TaxID=2740835 RepID=A0A8X6KQT2_TRICU|nr:hypothetical protein TNCT_731261 [Trichonephila clavata]